MPKIVTRAVGGLTWTRHYNGVWSTSAKGFSPDASVPPYQGPELELVPTEISSFFNGWTLCVGTKQMASNIWPIGKLARAMQEAAAWLRREMLKKETP
jgi:hypothetical protein